MRALAMDKEYETRRVEYDDQEKGSTESFPKASGYTKGIIQR